MNKLDEIFCMELGLKRNWNFIKTHLTKLYKNKFQKIA